MAILHSGKMTATAIVVCIIGFLLLVLTASSTVSGRPARTATTNTTGDTIPTTHSAGRRDALQTYQDPRWRMMTALSVLHHYSMVMKNRYRLKPPLIHINREFPNHLLLENILNRTCNLVEFYELSIKVNNSADSQDFYHLLSEVIIDACNWVNYLVTQTDALSISDPEFDTKNISCSSENTTLLHQYCYHAKISNLTSMTDIGDFALYEYVTEYHGSDENHVPATNFTKWLDTTSMPPDAKDTIHRNAVIAILQYILELDLI